MKRRQNISNTYVRSSNSRGFIATVATYTDPEWMISDVFLRTEAFDIAIISRELGTHNGVFIAREITKKNEACQIVLISERNRIFLNITR